jgi:hypothetical protein
LTGLYFREYPLNRGVDHSTRPGKFNFSSSPLTPFHACSAQICTGWHFVKCLTLQVTFLNGRPKRPEIELQGGRISVHRPSRRHVPCEVPESWSFWDKLGARGGAAEYIQLNDYYPNDVMDWQDLIWISHQESGNWRVLSKTKRHGHLI